jgi:arylsulfatase A-like enzyme
VVLAEEDFEGNQLAALRSRGLKYIVANADNPRGLPEVALFDIVADPGELENLAGRSAQICGAYIEDLTKESGTDLDALQAASKEGAASGGDAELTAAERCRLCALGYLSGDACSDC